MPTRGDITQATASTASLRGRVTSGDTETSMHDVSWLKAVVAAALLAFVWLWIEGRESGYAPGTGHAWNCVRSYHAQEFCMRRP